MSNIKKPNIDFDVSSDLYNIYIKDNSCWGVASELPAVIEITTPGSKKPYKSYFDKEDTSYDSIALGMTCGDECSKVELADGIYKIKITASPETFYKEYTYLKADQLEREIAKGYISVINGNCSDPCKSDVLQANFLLQGAYSFNSLSDIKGANESYKSAKKIIDKVNNCKDCR